MDIRQAIKAVAAGQDLQAGQMERVTHDIMGGRAGDMETAAFLVGLQVKGLRPAEILGGARAMRALATRVAVTLPADAPLLDTCGTGGSGSGKFNVSTAAAIVAACAGAFVAKHGNRGATSRSGSADLLEAAGVELGLSPPQIARCIEDVGVGFMFAPAHHSAMRHAMPARKAVGIRTVFNVLGPLTNPAGASHQLMGVYDGSLIEPLLEVFAELGSGHVLVVAAADGLDEISCCAPTRVGELRDGKTAVYDIEPEDLGVARRDSLDGLRVANPRQSLDIIERAFAGDHPAAADLIALNGGAAIYAAELCPDLAAGVARAREILAAGAATAKLAELVDCTRRLAAG